MHLLANELNLLRKLSGTMLINWLQEQMLGSVLQKDTKLSPRDVIHDFLHVILDWLDLVAKKTNAELEVLHYQRTKVVNFHVKCNHALLFINFKRDVHMVNDIFCYLCAF